MHHYRYSEVYVRMWTALAMAVLSLVPVFAGPRFEAARECALCHSRLTTTDGGQVTIGQFPLWSGTMMANAARDPLWRAKLDEEVRLTPAAAALIADKCLRCHAPAQQYGMRVNGGLMKPADLDDRGRDGVTCSVCHQITDEGLGEKRSFTGGFVVNEEQRIYGPHAKPFLMPMIHHVGYTAYESRHILESSLCGTCHTVITPTLDGDGRAVGEFVEQAPYLEWIASGYPAQGRTCQSCHMPVLRDRSGAPAASYIAHRPPGGPFPPTSPRTPFGRHFFVGGNVYGPQVLASSFPEEAAALGRVSARARENLEAAMAIEASAERRGGKVEVAVTIQNLTGHKLPSGFPSRRIWLHVTALDARGRVVFESGAGEARADNEPHHVRIRTPKEVMVYETNMADIQRRPTTSLIRAACFSKDNRILPAGFDEARALREVKPVGTDEDSDFVAGSDRVVYELPRETVSVRVEALYQSVKPGFFGAGTDARYATPVRMAGTEVAVP